jgi:hypothetical protein
MARVEKSQDDIGGESAWPCPVCGKFMRPAIDDFGQRYDCWNPECSGGDAYRERDGVLVGQTGSASGEGPTCQWCQNSLSGGTSYLPWEDGSNSHAYIICPSCKQENVQYGFGED